MRKENSNLRRLILFYFLFMDVLCWAISGEVPEGGEKNLSLKKVDVIHVSSSSFEPKNEATGEIFTAQMAFDADSKTRWSSNFNEPEWIEADLGKSVTIEKIILRWETAYGETYQIQVSNDKVNWYVVKSASKQKGGRNELDFPSVSARYVRMYGVNRGTQWGFSLYEFEIFGAEGKASVPLTNFKRPEEIVYTSADLSPRAYYGYAAQKAPKGFYPRWLTKEQEYWTLVGSPDSGKEVLLSEDGMIDCSQNGFSLMPYLYIDNRLITPRDAKSVSQSLEEGYLPIPKVEWDCGGISFSQKLFSFDIKGNSRVYIWYVLENRATETVSGKLFLTVRPFQLNPPWMYGGFVAIEAIERDKNLVKINKDDGLLMLKTPDEFGAVAYEEADVTDAIKDGLTPKKDMAKSVSKFCSAALAYNFNITPGQKSEYMFVVPLEEKIDKLKPAPNKNAFIRAYVSSKEMWRKRLGELKIKIPDKKIIDVLRSNLAYILISKDGKGFQPGSRNYSRTWMRDGAEIAAALLRTAHRQQEVKEYIDWVSGFQKPSGKIYPVIPSDGRNIDENLNEYDAQGEYIYSVAEYYRFTKDEKFLKDKFPSVSKALEYMSQLRKRRLTEDYKSGSEDKKRFYGILPESVSHEGYAPPGKHSYWDDFWGLKGLKDAQYIASILGRGDLVKQMRDEELDFRRCLLGSIELTQKAKDIKYIPGSAELGDFDATSTAIAVWPTEESAFLPQKEISFTLNRYYEETFLPRLAQGLTSAYTPYELRTANAYLILGEKEKALKMLHYFLTDMRPRAWNHWGEVVHPDYREPKYVGDMPHSWIGAIYMNLVRNLFAYEEVDKLILAAGIDDKWLDSPEGVRVEDMPTYYGKISYTFKREAGVLEFKSWGNVACPGGIILRLPSGKKISYAKLGNVRIEGNDIKDNAIKFDSLPVNLKIYYESSN